MTLQKMPYIVAAALAVNACGNTNRDSGNTAPEEGSVTQEQMVGAFGYQREITDEEMSMFRKATGEEGPVVYTPLSVSTQVVAGINYKFRCRYEDLSDGVRRKSADDSDRYGYCWITIFKPLPGRGEPEVTSIERDNSEKIGY